MTPDATTRTAESHGLPGVRGFPWWQWVLGAVVIAAYFVGMNRLLADPSFVERITFVNPTPYDVEVEVTNGERAGWLPLGEAEDGASTRYDEVLDQGDVWIVRLAGGEGGEVRITRNELQRSGWRVQIPAALEARLRATWGPPEPLVD